MIRQSRQELLILHAVRLLGYADGVAVSERFGTDPEKTRRVLQRAEQEGLVQRVVFADLDGWSLTDAGRAENERLLAIERENADPEHIIASVYRDFLPLNSRLLSAITDWQIKPIGADRLASNDHADIARDRGILEELAALGAELTPLVDRLSRVLMRFNGYGSRYDSALQGARNGEHDLVDRTDVDSCHRVWFQLHEDLVATLGIDRRSET